MQKERKICRKRGIHSLTSLFNFKNKKICPKSKRSQIWVETVIYTLVAFTIIGLVLSFVKPKMEEIRDRAIIEQSIAIMEDINMVVLSLIQGGAGNKRLIELGIKKGYFKIDGAENIIIFDIEDSRDTYSEPGKNVYHGSMIIYTEKRGKYNKVNLTMNYNEYNITYQGKDEMKILSKSSTPYKLFISNKGLDAQEEPKTIIDFELS